MILDEIQSSPRVFNGIREMVRGCNFRVIATGSYLGIIDIENYYSTNKQAYFYPAGYVAVLEMYPMTYLEVINACNENGVTDIKEIYKYYIRYGGFPEVVTDWIAAGNYSDCLVTLENIYNLLVTESQRYFHGAFPKEAWTDTLISVMKQIESKKAIPEGTELVYKFREADGLDVKKQDTVDSMRWMPACNLLFLGDVINNLNQPEKRIKYSYFMIDQGLIYLILNKELKKTFPSIEKGNMPGILAENFVALNIVEFTRPVTYNRTKPAEEIDFIAKMNDKAVAIEVKYYSGDTASSDKALERGEVKHIIKIQGKVEPSSEKLTVFPIHDCHKLGQLLGKEDGITKYDSNYLDF